MSKLVLNQDPDGIFKNIKNFALDIDGTVRLGHDWIDGALEFLNIIESTGRRYILVTNNSSYSCKAYAERLQNMGLSIDESQIITSGEITIKYILREYAGKSVYLLGNALLAQEFLEAGVILDDKNPDIVVAGFDTTADYQKLCKVCDFVRAGLPFIATHPDINCPIENGMVLDAGAFLALIEASTGRRPDFVVGKPSAEFAEATLAKIGGTVEDTAIVGDRIYTDVALGVLNGMKGILVLTGEAKFEDIESAKTKPDLVFSSILDMLKLMR